MIDARELISRATASLGGPASLDAALADAEAAVGIAADSGDERLALDALECRAQILTGMGEASAEDWLAVEHSARACGDWPRAAGALRMQAMRLLDDHAPDALAPCNRLFTLGSEQSMLEQQAWADSVRAEIMFLTGDWDGATTAAMRAVGRSEDAGATLRGWHVVIPIAAARRDTIRLGLAYYPYTLRSEMAGASPYRRLLDAAALTVFARAELCKQPSVAPSELLPAARGAAAMPHWLAALEVVVEAWIAAGEFVAAERALELMTASQSSGNASGLGAGVGALLRARLHHAEGAPPAGVAAHAWRALELFSGIGAPWWSAKAIAMLAEAGEAPPALRTEARRINAALSIPAR